MKLHRQRVTLHAADRIAALILRPREPVHPTRARRRVRRHARRKTGGFGDGPLGVSEVSARDLDLGQPVERQRTPFPILSGVLDGRAHGSLGLVEFSKFALRFGQLQPQRRTLVRRIAPLHRQRDRRGQVLLRFAIVPGA